MISDSQRVEVDYSSIRKNTVYELLKKIMSNPKSYYCLMYGQLILESNHKISLI